MGKKIVMEQYPVFYKTFKKSSKNLDSIEQFIDLLMEKIESDPMAKFIALFDHYDHTQKRKGEIDEKVQAAYNLVFCFGPKIISPLSLALKPRSFGIVDLGDSIQVNFMQAPAEAINNKMVQWVENLS